jgi:maltose O-acetyltransferase
MIILSQKPAHVRSQTLYGNNSNIVSGVTIGDGAIIGLGTLVSQDVPPMTLVGNSPMRILKQRNESHFKNLIDADARGGISGYRWE